VAKVRQIIEIDEDKCTGCGLCVPDCHEGAIQIIDGKAKLIAENHCDGLGNCLGACPEGAIRIVERPAEEFDEEAVKAHLASLGEGGGGCPSSAPSVREVEEVPGQPAEVPASCLGTWPVKLELLPPHAPFLIEGHLLLTADCAPVALASFNQRFLKERTVAIACPKFGPADLYVNKLTTMFANSGVKAVTVIVMEVPCCSGLVRMAQEALAMSGADIEAKMIVVGLDGEIQEESELPRLAPGSVRRMARPRPRPAHGGFGGGCPSSRVRTLR